MPEDFSYNPYLWRSVYEVAMAEKNAERRKQLLVQASNALLDRARILEMNGGSESECRALEQAAERVREVKLNTYGDGQSQGNELSARMSETAEILDDVSRTGFEFIMTDLNLALTLARIAADAHENADKRARNLGSARRAYETVKSISQRLTLTSSDQDELNKKLAQVRSALEKLGEDVS